jgi:penicillin amidase
MEIIGPLLAGMDSPATDILRNWNLRYDAASTGAVIFENVYQELHREVFGKNGFGTQLVDYLGEETGIFIDFYLAFDRVLLSETSPWFGNSSREEIYMSALDRALQEPVRKWGDLRQFPLTHILFGGKLPRILGFDRGPVTGIGSRATIHQGQIYRSAGRMTTFFPSFRIISDLSETTSWTNLSGGPSDRRFSRWYVSDLDNWVKGSYKRLGPEIGGTTHPL